MLRNAYLRCIACDLYAPCRLIIVSCFYQPANINITSNSGRCSRIYFHTIIFYQQNAKMSTCFIRIVRFLYLYFIIYMIFQHIFLQCQTYFLFTVILSRKTKFPGLYPPGCMFMIFLFSRLCTDIYPLV